MHFEVYHFLSIQHFASTSGISLIFTSFWKPFQKKTFVSRRERTASDLKASKERLIALLCWTQTGDSILRPIVIKKLFDPAYWKTKIRIICQRILEVLLIGSWLLQPDVQNGLINVWFLMRKFILEKLKKKITMPEDLFKGTSKQLGKSRYECLAFLKRK